MLKKILLIACCFAYSSSYGADACFHLDTRSNEYFFAQSDEERNQLWKGFTPFNRPIPATRTECLAYQIFCPPGVSCIKWATCPLCEPICEVGEKVENNQCVLDPNSPRAECESAEHFRWTGQTCVHIFAACADHFELFQAECSERIAECNATDGMEWSSSLGFCKPKKFDCLNDH